MNENVTIVSSHYKEDIIWLEKSPYPVIIVGKEGGNTVDGSKYEAFHILPNKGNEASSYLWYIINYWDVLPDKIVFIHGHETASHQHIHIFDAIEKYKEKDFQAINESYYYIFIPNNSFRDWWKQIYAESLGQIPDKLVFEPFAQFLVSKERIRSHPLHFYQKLYNCCLCMEDNATSYRIGAFFEVTWHLLFDKNDKSKLDAEINNLCFLFGGNWYCKPNGAFISSEKYKYNPKLCANPNKIDSI